jgi:uncharacterized membrane protein
MQLTHLDFAMGTNKPGFDLLLIGHVACGLAGFGALVTSGVQATRLGRAGPGGAGETLLGYFAPGVNWVGRALYGVPLLGLALLADSGGQDKIGDTWVIAGLSLWTLAALLAEGFLWPAERRIQSALVDTVSTGTGGRFPAPVRRDCRVVGLLGAVLAAIFLVATVLMVARPR